ncbi:B12-binding domain-containing radical SAM protein, partial [bacterium]|nr:B12-binding domain-containing radical SAM protein [bacterium]
GVFSAGIGYLSASVKEAGHKSSLIHVIKPLEKDEFYEKIDENKPDIIAFSAMSHQHDVVKQLASWLKERYSIPTVYGGVHASIDPEGSIQTDGIDMVCIGEGERPIVELLNRMDTGGDLDSIESMWTKRNGKIFRNSVAPLVEDIDEFPFPDREVFDYKKLFDFREKIIYIFATRGCPFNCSYCINHQYKKLYPNYQKYVRHRKPENIIEEIKEVRKKYPELVNIVFLDDAMFVKREWIKEFLPKYRDELGLPFYGNTSIKLLDEELIALSVEAGAKHFSIGIESGNDTIRREVLNRRMSDKEIIEKAALAGKYGLELTSYNIVGIPHEMLENTLETVKLNSIINTEAQHVSILQPYKFTDLYELSKREGYLKEEKISSFFKDSVLELPTITQTEIQFAYKYFMIFVRLYKSAYKMPVNSISRFFEQMIDWFYLNKKLKRFQLFTYPVFFFLVRPVKFAKIYTLKYFPKTGYKVKKALRVLGIIKKMQ